MSYKNLSLILVFSLMSFGCATKVKSGNYLNQLDIDEIFLNLEAKNAVKCIVDNDFNCFKSYYANGGDLNHKGRFGATFLLIALNDFQIFKFLLSKGLDPNTVFEDNSSVLSEATKMSDLRFLETLLNNGANPNLIIGDYGETSIFYALSNIPALELLFKSGANVNWRLKANGELNETVSGQTALMSALVMDKVDSAKFLLKKGADPNLKTLSGRGPLQIIERKKKVLLKSHKLYSDMIELEKIIQNKRGQG